MAKIVHVVRHAEAEHNVSHAAEFKRDTRLTPHGRTQLAPAKAIVRSLLQQPEVVISSPVLRALQTANGVAPERLARVVETDLRERVANPEALCELPLVRTTVTSPRLRFDEYDWTEHDAVLAAAGGT